MDNQPVGRGFKESILNRLDKVTPTGDVKKVIPNSRI
jgi:hypothetical protein